MNIVRINDKITQIPETQAWLSRKWKPFNKLSQEIEISQKSNK